MVNQNKHNASEPNNSLSKLIPDKVNKHGETILLAYIS